MARIVITGSSRGIGLGLALAFRQRGHDVVVSARQEESVDAAVAQVEAAEGRGGVLGIPADVTERSSVQALWDQAADVFGGVDIWINNAGVSGPKRPVSQLTDAEMAPVIATNIWGVIFGTQIALAGMNDQGHGKIFNFEGFGSTGMTAPGMTIYGMTKCAVTYFTRSMIKELNGCAVLLGTISPGIVITDLLEDTRDEDPAKWIKTKRMYDVLADRVEDVAPFIAERVLRADKQGTAIRWLTTGKAARRFLLQPLRKRRVMPD